MKQAYVSKGVVKQVETPSPSLKKGSVKIKVEYSSISVGTEMSSLKGSSKSKLRKVLEDPSKLKKVLDIVKQQGVKSAKAKISTVSEDLRTIGYSISGKVIEVASDITDFKVGDLVCAGGNTANHAEMVVVPKNLVVNIPYGLDMKLASTGTIGSIALHGVHRANLKVGEFAVIYGTGLLGLIALQILKCSGVRVACVDIDSNRLELAKKLGAECVINSHNENPVNIIKTWTNGYGTDAVLFFASTNKDEPLSQAFQMCRRKGKVVLVGVSGMNIRREDIYKNEIDLVISTSYGPGRYDEKYEYDGLNYPYAYVRWTENRNIAEYLRLLKDGKIDLNILSPMIYDIEDVEKAYEEINDDHNNNILSILKYQQNDEKQNNKVCINKRIPLNKKIVTIGLIGAGNFAKTTLLPIILQNNDKFRLKTIVNRTGDKSINIARQFNVEYVSTNLDDIFLDKEIDLIMICTQHDSHAELVLKSLYSKKHVYVEKPLAVSYDELEKIEHFYSDSKTVDNPILTVGFNRRFSPYSVEIKKHLKNRISPLLIHYRMNAGYVPQESWIHRNGGRIAGEACHIIDLMSFFTDSEVKEIVVNSMNPLKGKFQKYDNKSISISYVDGSIAIIDYFSCGSKFLSKEYMEIHFDEKSIVMDDYKSISGYGLKTKISNSSFSKKGHKEEWVELYNKIQAGEPLINLRSLIETTGLSIYSSIED